MPPSPSASCLCLCLLLLPPRLQIHSALSSTFRHFKHGPGDVEDACWQLLGELQLLLAAPEDRLFLARLMEPVAEWGPISTPGAPFSKVGGVGRVCAVVRWLAWLCMFQRTRQQLQTVLKDLGWAVADTQACSHDNSSVLHMHIHPIRLPLNHRRAVPVCLLCHVCSCKDLPSPSCAG
jgi:hypothetical protein